jgi:RNA recognition motif-containing protein
LSITEESLTTLFQQYPGFKEVRMVPGKSNIAFVEYETVGYAEGAREALNGFEISPNHKMGCEFAKH